jgi:predicted glycogen debranching enzyme
MLVKASNQQMHSLLSREWLDTNLRGSYSSNTLVDCPTRRYHGLLISDAGYLPEKHNFLAKFETSLTHRGRTIDLFTNKHPGGVFFPEGYNHFEFFRYDIMPAMGFRVGPLLIERSQILLHAEDTVLVRYRMIEGEVTRLTFRPLLAYRNHHHLRRESLEFQVKTFPDQDGWKIEPLPQKPALYMTCDQEVEFYPGPFWVKDIEYPIEQERGFDYQEDLFCPGIFEATLTPDRDLIFAFSLSRVARQRIKTAWDEEVTRRKTLLGTFAHSPSPLAELKYEAEKFFVQRADGQLSIVAGYPWFGEWGRDAMIALPGLTLHRGQAERLLAVVKTFLAQASQGLIPNFLGQASAPANYNSIDAVFWMFEALRCYRQDQGLTSGLRELVPTLRALLLDLVEGRCPFARVDERGLIAAGDRNTQLTWMDAKVHGQPVTPRHGYAVEINALWYNAVGFFIELQQSLGDSAEAKFLKCLEVFPRSFRDTFWLPEAGYLADSVADGKIDPAVRPNQIFAVSLELTPLTPREQKSVVAKVTNQLVTAYGLRTLAPLDPQFEPFYQGGPAQRDQAYHQGTVWPWLLFHYAKAYLRTADDPLEARAFLQKTFEPLWTEHLVQAGVMGVSEIFDAYPPHAPNGCIFQAWSVAELIRFLDVTGLMGTNV